MRHGIRFAGSWERGLDDLKLSIYLAVYECIFIKKIFNKLERERERDKYIEFTLVETFMSLKIECVCQKASEVCVSM